ncbi:GNAT family N-acetyltransferase [Streptomyces sp. Rer75]|uniref:GNAT family N-acetyltransferase n=1 Tax=unclassified Streptomyces TaxID=2593676 RepID=UPI0015CFAB7B|nr:GNAT family N-acetyltransferase [Streptomyces sp. Rer75]QLH21454.1 GNAT family N-acetyltransferase [Streptomyces sp. Rer75]
MPRTPEAPYAAGPSPWAVAARPVTDPVAVTLLREYMTDVADRYYRLRDGRDATPEEIERALREMPSDDLAPPDGVLLVAHHDGAPAGCAGLRRRDGHTGHGRTGEGRTEDGRTAELKRVFLRPGKRGLGGGAALLAAIETAARELGVVRIVLDTRRDLVEARALYARHGYRDVPAFSEGPYAEVWMAKDLV